MNKHTSVLLIIMCIFSMCRPGHAQSTGREDLIQYVQTLAKKGGGYGWTDQPDAHLTPTFAAVGILHAINALPDQEKRQELIRFVQTHHPQFGTKVIQALTYKQKSGTTYLGPQWRNGSEAGSSGSVLRDLLYQQIQAILWLGGDASRFTPLVRLWKSQAGNIGNYEKHNYPVLYQEMMTPVCRQLLGITLSDASPTKSYLKSRRRTNGSFNNAPARDGGDGNILNTYWSLLALYIFGKEDSLQVETVRWLHACQLQNGGFTHQPDPQIGSNDEVIYTWAAIKALHLLSAKPKNKKACIRYLLSLRNADGGFGNRPGLPSTPMSTYYAIDALKTLGALSFLRHSRATTYTATTQNFEGLNVYAVQFEAPGTGSPAEAVMLADSLHIHLWGCKNGPGPAWLANAQKIADTKNVPVTFFKADEPYGKFVHVKGMGSFGHILDFIAPAEASLPAVGNDPSWLQYHTNYVQPLLKDGGALLLQISNNEPLARILLDESIKNGGYAAISTIHFTQNFLFFLPYLYQYRYQLPFVALEDAHGTQPWWWTDDLLHYRTLFLAKAPTYTAMIQALKNNWVVAVRHDSLSKYKTRILGGAPGVQQYILSHKKQWKWWGSNPNVLHHPWAAITVVRPSDTFEVARPEKGITVRIRCWWRANTGGLIMPIVQLTALHIDNQSISPKMIKKENARKRIMDSYYVYHLPNPSPGKHTITVTLTHLKNGTTKTLTQTFKVEGY